MKGDRKSIPFLIPKSAYIGFIKIRWSCKIIPRSRSSRWIYVPPSENDGASWIRIMAWLNFTASIPSSWVERPLRLMISLSFLIRDSFSLALSRMIIYVFSEYFDLFTGWLSVYVDQQWPDRLAYESTRLQKGKDIWLFGVQATHQFIISSTSWMKSF